MKRLWSQTLKVFLPTTGLLFLLCETLTQSWTFDTLSRRDALLIAGGGVVYGKVAGDALARLAENAKGMGEIRPSEHEDRVKQTFLRAVELAPQMVIAPCKSWRWASELNVNLYKEVIIQRPLTLFVMDLYGPACD